MELNIFGELPSTDILIFIETQVIHAGLVDQGHLPPPLLALESLCQVITAKLRWSKLVLQVCCLNLQWASEPLVSFSEEWYLQTIKQTGDGPSTEAATLCRQFHWFQLRNTYIHTETDRLLWRYDTFWVHIGVFTCPDSVRVCVCLCVCVVVFHCLS